MENQTVTPSEDQTTVDAPVIKKKEKNKTPKAQEPEVKAPEEKEPKRELKKVPFKDPMPDVKNTDEVEIEILKDFNKHKAGTTKTVSGFLAKQLVYKKVAKVA